LGAGDEISVRVLDLDEIPDRPVRINQQGDFTLPLAGELHAAGLSTRQVQEEIRGRLQGLLKSPAVTVTLTEFREQPVTVLGAVNSPGVKQIRGRKTLLEAISDAGGLRTDAGAVVKITRVRSAGPIPLPGARLDTENRFYVAEAEIRSLLQAQNPGENIPLLAHDVVSVPPAELVYVLGEVARPGGYEVKSSRTISILDAIALAGGANRNASSSRARVLRPSPGKSERTEIVVDLNHMLAGKEKEFSLQGSDILYIPTNKGKVITTRALETMIGTGGSIAVFRGSR
jgi:polysaccharide export outer membrane protein